MTQAALLLAAGRIKGNLMHQRRFGQETLAAWRNAAAHAEGDLEELLAEIAKPATSEATPATMPDSPDEAARIGRLRAALSAIATTLDDHELRQAAKDVLQADADCVEVHTSVDAQRSVPREGRQQ